MDLVTAGEVIGVDAVGAITASAVTRTLSYTCSLSLARSFSCSLLPSFQWEVDVIVGYRISTWYKLVARRISSCNPAIVLEGFGTHARDSVEF